MDKIQQYFDELMIWSSFIGLQLHPSKSKVPFFNRSLEGTLLLGDFIFEETSNIRVLGVISTTTLIYEYYVNKQIAQNLMLFI